MIRKPDAHEFRESSTVVALRDAGTLAVEGARGVRDGTKSFVRTGMMALFGLGFLLTVGSHLGPLALLLMLGGGIALAVKSVQRRARLAERDRAARWGEPAAPALRAGQAVEPARLDLSVAAAARSAAKIGVPAILFFPTSSITGYMLPFTLGGAVALALAVLIIVRLAGDRTILCYDAETLTVRGLLGEATILWADVGDLVVRTASWWDVRVPFTSGSRRNIVVLGRYNRLGGPDTLYIPVDLLGLDASALARLLTRLLALRAGTAPSGAAAPASFSRMPSTPREPAAPRPDHEPFDPDAIMARYLAERDALIAAQRPEPIQPSRPVFGRKIA